MFSRLAQRFRPTRLPTTSDAARWPSDSSASEQAPGPRADADVHQLPLPAIKKPRDPNGLPSHLQPPKHHARLSRKDAIGSKVLPITFKNETDHWILWTASFSLRRVSKFVGKTDDVDLRLYSRRMYDSCSERFRLSRVLKIFGDGGRCDR